MIRIIQIIFGLFIACGTALIIHNNAFDFLFTFYLVSTLCLLAGSIFIRQVKSEINISFSLYCLSFASWILFAYEVGRRTGFSTTFFEKYIFVVASFLAAFFLYFSFVFPRKSSRFNSIVRVSIFVMPLIVFLMTQFNLIIDKYVLIVENAIQPAFGVGYPVFVIFILGYMLLGIYNLIKSYNDSKSVERIQVGYVLLGMALSAILLSITNLILPLFGNIKLIGFGPLSTLFLIVFTSYAILKHRLMSVEVVIQQGVIYALVSAMIVAFYASAVVMSETLLRGIVGYSSILITSLSVLVIAMFFQPLVKLLQSFTDKLFFKGRYNYRKTLRAVGHKIASIIKLEELTKLLATTFIEAMRVSEISLLLFDVERSKYRSVYIEHVEGQSRYKRIEIDATNPIVLFLKEEQEALVADEFEDKGMYSWDPNIVSAVRDEIMRLGGSLWIPIISKNELLGIIFLGKKLSGDSFTVEDIELLNTLADQSAVALENIRLYEEVLSMKNYTQDVLDAMISGVLTIDTRGQIITFNPMAEQITGLLAFSVINRNYKTVFSDKNIIYQILDSTLQGKSYNNFESSILSGDRGLVPVSLNSSWLKDSSGKKSGALITITELTEVKVLEDKVRRADKIGALGTMAAGMAHEIKNPLSSMKVLSQLFPLKYNDEEFRGKFMEIMPREISRIDRIVESLLGFARATSLKIVPIDLKELLLDDVKYFTEQAKNSKVEILTTFADLPLISGDADQLSQVFSNLILNAIQAMPEGGQLKIVTREGKKIENILQTIIVEVSDTGHGITIENLKKLFDPFFTTKYAGTGLGLTISHSIVDGHKGTIDVKSQIGQGTIFTVALPVKQDLV